MRERHLSRTKVPGATPPSSPRSTPNGAARGTGAREHAVVGQSPATECSCVASAPLRARARAGSWAGAGEHGLARARRADHQEVVPAGRRDLEGPSGLRLSPHFGEVDASTPRGRGSPRSLGRAPTCPAGTRRPRRAWPPRRPEPLDLRRLAPVRGRDHDAVAARRAPRRWPPKGRRASARTRPSRDSSPANAYPTTAGVRGTCAVAASTPTATGRSSPGPSFRRLAGARFTDHAAESAIETGALDGRAHTIARVVHRGAGKAGEDQRRESSPDERLDRDEMSTDAEDGDPHDPSIHPVRTIRRRSDTTRAYHRATERPAVVADRGREGMMGFGLAVIMAFAFAVTNGLHDAANAIATLIATRGARPLPPSSSPRCAT